MAGEACSACSGGLSQVLYLCPKQQGLGSSPQKRRKTRVAGWGLGCCNKLRGHSVGRLGSLIFYFSSLVLQGSNLNVFVVEEDLPKSPGVWDFGFLRAFEGYEPLFFLGGCFGDCQEVQEFLAVMPEHAGTTAKGSCSQKSLCGGSCGGSPVEAAVRRSESQVTGDLSCPFKA